MTGERKYASELWSKVLSELQKLVTEMAYKQFFEPIVPLKAETAFSSWEYPMISSAPGLPITIRM